MPAWGNAALNIVTFLIMTIGLLGLIIPLLPGLVLIWLAALGYGLFAGFGTLGGWMFGIMTVLMLVGSIVDNILVGVGARQGGASWFGIGLGLLAGIVGTLVFPPFGGLVAAPLVMFVYEVRRQGSVELVIQSIKGMAAGWGAGFVARFLVGLVMVFLWVVWAWAG
jgi:uncharacterized protein